MFTVQRLLEFSEVRLIRIADGIDTFAKHSTLTFGLKSLGSAIYLTELRDKTLRGLQGRALAGFGTGGVPFGYCLRKERMVQAKRSERASRSMTNKLLSLRGSSSGMWRAARLLAARSS